MIAQNCGNGNIPMASGYVMKASAGPPVATGVIGRPVTSGDLEYLIYTPIYLHFNEVRRSLEIPN